MTDLAPWHNAWYPPHSQLDTLATLVPVLYGQKLVTILS